MASGSNLPHVLIPGVVSATHAQRAAGGVGVRAVRRGRRGRRARLGRSSRRSGTNLASLLRTIRYVFSMASVSYRVDYLLLQHKFILSNNVHILVET